MRGVRRARTKRNVVLLQRDGRVGGGLRGDDGRKGGAGDGEGGVVDRGDLRADGDGERRVHIVHRDGVKHHRLEVARDLRGARERGEALLAEDRLQRLRGGRPCGARLAEAEVVHGGAEGDGDGAGEGVVGIGGVEVASLVVRAVGVLGSVDRCQGVHVRLGGGSPLQENVGAVGANTHLFFSGESDVQFCYPTGSSSLRRTPPPLRMFGGGSDPR